MKNRLKRLFTRYVWTVVKTRPCIREEKWVFFDNSDKEHGIVVLERNQFGDERAYWTSGCDFQSIDLIWAKQYLGII